ncbi:DUF3618 domain-containing protein [Mycobacterium camsae]|uniref:DUF3618 domain-containing protein n=1 Tax=Mycobacterium gordonae TaxID=1778 RepID=UPI00197D11AD|nr:DUF3618 domain-containing protein [Mycobacterium gordonae]
MAEAERTPPPTQSPEPGPDAEIRDIQRDIERTRTQLGETVEVLSSKADVAERAKEAARAAQPTLIVAASAAGVALVALLWWRRRRR